MAFLDEHFNVGEWAANGKVSRNLFKNAMKWLSESLATVEIESLALLDLDGSEDLTWDELYPAIQNQCLGYGGGIVEDELGGYAGEEMC